MYGKVLSMLEAYGTSLNRWEAEHREENTEHGVSAAWDFLREQFGADSDRYEEMFDEAAAMLEHGFDFMEAAFGTGQEIVIFVTELNTDYYSMRFLQNYDCERYYRYNKELLFDESSRSIEARLRALGR